MVASSVTNGADLNIDPAVDVDRDGLVTPEALRAALRDDTALVSVMLANNEVGTIQPIAALVETAHAAGALFHCDAVQGVGKIPVNVEALGVDLLTLSGHKFHGPKGVGALYVRKGVQLESLIHGGSQEQRLRAGTENVPAIAGLGRAAELAVRRLEHAAQVAVRRDRLEEGIHRLVPDAMRNGHGTERLPNVLNLTLPGLRGESLVVAMDAHGIAFSSGSACKAGSPEPTHVLMAMGRTEEEAPLCGALLALLRHDRRGCGRHDRNPRNGAERDGSHGTLSRMQVGLGQRVDTDGPAAGRPLIDRGGEFRSATARGAPWATGPKQ